jgi:transcriptional regulator with XRE-family HTH domain
MAPRQQDAQPLATFAENVRQARLARQWTQEELAARANMDSSELRRLETARRDPGIRLVTRLGRALELQPSMLLDGVDELARDAPDRVDRITQEARRGADKITREARRRADEITREARRRAEGIEREARRAAADATREAPSDADEIAQEARRSADEVSEHALVDPLEPIGEGVGLILGPDGRPLRMGDHQYRALELAVRDVSDEVLKRLAAAPRLMRDMHWEDFEALVAQLFRRDGFEVVTTPSRGDRGVDMYAARRTGLGSFLFVVECKRHVAPIGPSFVRELAWVVEREQATGGVLATSSRFTPGAREEQRQNRFRMHLKDFTDMHAWLLGERPL